MVRLTAFFLLFSFAVGCGDQSPIVGIEQVPAPRMVPFEGPGFRLEVPEEWETVVVGSKVIVQPKGVLGEATVTLELMPYSAGESPETAVEETMAERSAMKKSIQHTRLKIAGFPAIRQLLISDGSNRPPDQFFHMLATPAGKITVTASVKRPADFGKYIEEFEGIVHSVQI